MNTHEYAIIWYAGNHLYTTQRDDGTVAVYSSDELVDVVEPENIYGTIDGIAVASGHPHTHFAVPVSALEDFLGTAL